MRHKIAAATAATVAVGVATMLMAVVAPSAGAAEIEKARSTPGSDCPVNAVCLYTEKKYRGTVLVDRGAKGRNSYGNANDTFESIINRTGEDVFPDSGEDRGQRRLRRA